MRLLFLMLIFAIGFGGYATAADLACGTNYKSSGPENMLVHNGDLTDCLNHSDSAESDDGVGFEGSPDRADHLTQAKCMDCHHGCVLHVIATAEYSIKLPVPAATFKLLAARSYTDSDLLSLLRPPKSPV